MRRLSSAMRRTLREGAASLCHCWRIVRTDGVAVGLTDHDAEIRFDDMRFSPNASIRFSAFEAGLGLETGGSAAEGTLASDRLSEEDLRDGSYDAAAYDLWLTDWRRPTARCLLMRGRFGAVRFEKGRFTVTLRGDVERLNRPQGRVYQTDCDAELGDARCAFAFDGRPTFERTLEIVDRKDERLTLPSVPERDGWFAGGVVTCRGRRFSVRDDAEVAGARVVRLVEIPPSYVARGLSVTLRAGCDKTFATCREKFGNVLNFQGFPTIPDEDVLLRARSLS